MFEYLLGGAGSHKTTRLCQRAVAFLKSAGGHPSRLVLTTYAREAANQLLDRVRSLVLRDPGLSWQQKQEIVTGLDAATIGTNHSLGRAALEQHWLELGKTPAADVIDEATRREIMATAIGSVPLQPDERVKLDRLARRLGRSDAGRGGAYADDVRVLVDMISDVGGTGPGFVRDCVASVNMLCDELDRRRESGNSEDTLAGFIERAERAAADLAVHPQGNTGKTRDARELIEDFLAEPTWNGLDKLVKVEAHRNPTRRQPITPDAAIVEPLRTAARKYYLFPEFTADLRDYVEVVAGLASKVHEEYRRMVAEANRVDFADMERALRDLLEEPVRRKGFCARFGYIGSDESQDMTARTAGAFKLVTREVGAGAWLADPNQSIYPFRGADHAAVHRAAVELLAEMAPGTGPTTHGQNHRSPPGIIRFVNDLFHTLSPPGLPARAEPAAAGAEAAGQAGAAAKGRGLPLPHAQDAPPAAKASGAFPGRIQRWLLSESNFEKRFAQLADGVERLITRPDDPVKPEDICIMVRTNARKKQVAEALAARGIKAALRSSTLFESREVRVIIAALGILVDDRDMLAEATLRHLLDEGSTDADADSRFTAWLVNRIQGRGTKREDAVQDTDAGPVPVWKDALRSARNSRATAVLSPVSAVMLAIEATGVVGRIAAWGDSFGRQSHVDSVTAMARNYEKRARAAGRPATVAGFVAMCHERLDQEARESSGNTGAPTARDDDFDTDTPPKDHRGVRVMTCHATKGLGYRVTIVADFSLRKASFSPFEITTIDGKPHVWPNPLGNRANVELDQVALAIPAGRARFHKKLESEAQLLYVAFTRSEGELVIAHGTAPDDTSWLSTVFGPSNPVSCPTGIDHFLPLARHATHVVHALSAPELPGSTSEPLSAVAEYVFVSDLSANPADADSGTDGVAVGTGIDVNGRAPDPIAAIVSAQPRPIMAVSHAPRYRSPSDYAITKGPWQVDAAFIPIPVPGSSDPELVTGSFKRAAAARADAIGEAFHAFMAAIPSLPQLEGGDGGARKPARALWETVAARCLRGFLSQDEIAAIAAAGLTPAVMVDRGHAFVEWCSNEFGASPRDWIVEAGVSGPASDTVGGTWRGRIDLMLVAKAGRLAGERVLVDHKAVMATRGDCVRKAAEYLGEVTAYAEALHAPDARSLAPAAIYIHFPLAAAIVPLVTGTPRSPGPGAG